MTSGPTSMRRSCLAGYAMIAGGLSARDTKLDRPVAIKILPEAFAAIPRAARPTGRSSPLGARADRRPSVPPPSQQRDDRERDRIGRRHPEQERLQHASHAGGPGEADDQ